MDRRNFLAAASVAAITPSDQAASASADSSTYSAVARFLLGHAVLRRQGTRSTQRVLKTAAPVPLVWDGAATAHEGSHLRKGVRATDETQYALAVTSGTAALQSAVERP